MDSSNTSLYAVIISGLVAIASVLVAPLINSYLEHRRWKREDEKAREAAVNDATFDLLELLAAYRSGNVEQAMRGNWLEVRKNLIKSYYVWELAVWPFCSDEFREEIKDMRESIEMNSEDWIKVIYESSPRFANRIMHIQRNMKVRGIFNNILRRG